MPAWIFILPFVLLMVFSCCRFAGKKNAKATAVSLEPVTVEVFAQQFKWSVRYPGKDRKLGKTSWKEICEANPLGIDTTDSAGADDLVVTDTFFLPVGKTNLVFRSRDVIHSAYFPHFRAQMNCVPGMQTQLQMDVPEKFLQPPDSTQGYWMMCNKICGNRHFEMKIPVKVLRPEDFLKKAGNSISP